MVHPHLVPPYRLDHESALFPAWKDRVYSHYDDPLVLSWRLSERDSEVVKPRFKDF
jgi:hypothetical protein